MLGRRWGVSKPLTMAQDGCGSWCGCWWRCWQRLQCSLGLAALSRSEEAVMTVDVCGAQAQDAAAALEWRMTRCWRPLVLGGREAPDGHEVGPGCSGDGSGAPLDWKCCSGGAREVSALMVMRRWGGWGSHTVWRWGSRHRGRARCHQKLEDGGHKALARGRQRGVIKLEDGGHEALAHGRWWEGSREHSVAHSSGMVEVNPGRSSAVCLRTWSLGLCFK
jgi:hypothetical protein